MNRLVSVLIPSYNHERYIGACLDSVIASTYPEKEVLVTDDGSTDGTLEVIRAWAAEHPEIPVEITSQTNHGATATLNDLLSRARGDFVLPMASDDYLLPDGMAAQVAALEADPTIKAIFGDAVVVDAEGHVLFESMLTGYRHANLDRLRDRLGYEVITNWAVAGPVILFRRAAVIDVGGYDERLRAEDWDLYLRLIARGWLRFHDVRVAAYRVHGRNEHLNAASKQTRDREQGLIARKLFRSFHGVERRLLLARAISAHPVVRPVLEFQPLRRVLRVGYRAVVRRAPS